MKPKPKAATPAPEDHTKERAAYWRVSERVMQLWKKRGVPVDDDTAMLHWYLELSPSSQGKLSEGFRERMSAAHGHSKKDYWSAFVAKFPNQSSPDQVAQIQSLERHLHFADFALSEARAAKDALAIKTFTQDLVTFSKAIKEQKALADKLGVESGELLPKSQAERMVAAWTYWSMVCIDAVLPVLSEKLVGMKSPSEVRAILEPALLSKKYLEPFAQAKRVASGVAVPGWFTDRLVDSVDDFIENGRALMEAPPAAVP